MRRETDFFIEGELLGCCVQGFLLTPFRPSSAENASKTIAKLAATPSLRNDVYIPRVFPELSTDRILTMEYVQGCRINDLPALTRYNFKGGFKGIMDKVLDLFAVQIFEWRWCVSSSLTLSSFDSCLTGFPPASFLSKGFTAILMSVPRALCLPARLADSLKPAPDFSLATSSFAQTRQTLDVARSSF